MSPALSRLMSLLKEITYCSIRHSDIRIKETGDDAKLKDLVIHAPYESWFAFDPDRLRGKAALMSPLLAIGAEHSHHRACDAVIAVEREGKLQFIFIDMKSDSATGYAGQFQSTRQFVRYLLGLLQEFYGYHFPLVEENFVVFHTSKSKSAILKKYPTSMKSVISRSSSDPKKPRKEIVSDGAIVWLNQLLS